MYTEKERNEIIKTLDGCIKEQRKVERQSRDTLFISLVLFIIASLSVIAFGEVFLSVSWIFTSVISITLCFRMFYLHSERKEIRKETRRVTRMLLSDDSLSEPAKRKIEELLMA